MKTIKFTREEFLDQSNLENLNIMIVNRLLANGIPARIQNGLVVVTEGSLSVEPDITNEFITYRYDLLHR